MQKSEDQNSHDWWFFRRIRKRINLVAIMVMG